MHRSHIEAIIQKQIKILGISKVRSLLLSIVEVQLDDTGRLINLTGDDEKVLNQIITVFLDFSHEIVKGLLFDMPEAEQTENSEGEMKTIEPVVSDEKGGVSPDISHLEKDELVALSPEEPFKHAGSDAIEKALQALDNRVSAESGQSGPSDNPAQNSPKQGSVEKLNEMIKQYNQ